MSAEVTRLQTKVAKLEGRLDDALGSLSRVNEILAANGLTARESYQMYPNPVSGQVGKAPSASMSAHGR